MSASKKRGIGAIFNAVDITIIVVVLLAIAGGVFYFVSDGFQDGDKVTVYYTVEIEGLKEGFSQNIGEGITVKDSIKSYELGIIDNVSVVKSVAWNFNKLTKEYFEYNPPGEEVLHITVKADGYEYDDKIISEDNVIKIGRVMYLEVKGLAVSGYVIDLRTEPREGK